MADADAFYVAVARMVDPEGVGKEPLLIVGGSRESRGVVCSASYETRKFGVRSAMPIARALRLCPQAVCVPIPRRACTIKSHEISAVLQRWAPVVEGASIDEWYLDLGGTERLYRNESLADTARRIRDDVREKTDLSVSIGGGTTRLIAKLAVERAKPKPDNDATGVYVVLPGGEPAFMSGIVLAEIPLVGPKLQDRLAGLGLRTVPDVLRYDPPSLRYFLGERLADWLYERVRGIDAGAVEPALEAKSLSRDETFAKDIDNDEKLESEMMALVVRAAHDLRSEGLVARTIAVRIRDVDFRDRRAARTLAESVVSDRVIFEVARSLLHKLRSARRVPARLLSVALTSLSVAADADQLVLFDQAGSRVSETDRDRTIARTVDALRARFGDDAILPGRVSGR
ncbi:MAG: DNA polymerase IV [Gemmatimonadota bacterium]|nr:DNA polymerase IV [Gemmatimonadota bacterium]